MACAVSREQSLHKLLSALSQPREDAFAGRSRAWRTLYFTGWNQSFENGDKLTHGQSGEIVGPAAGEHQGNGLQVQFPGNKVSINCLLPWLSREKPPSLPGGHEAGDQLYWTGPNQSFEDGDTLV